MNPIGVILWCFWVWAYNSDPSLLTWNLMPNSRIHRTCICEKSAEAQIRVYIGKQNCAHFDIPIAQEAYTGDWYSPLLGRLICTWIENELSEFSVIGYGANEKIFQATGFNLVHCCAIEARRKISLSYLTSIAIPKHMLKTI